MFEDLVPRLPQGNALGEGQTLVVDVGARSDGRRVASRALELPLLLASDCQSRSLGENLTPSFAMKGLAVMRFCAGRGAPIGLMLNEELLLLLLVVVAGDQRPTLAC